MNNELLGTIQVLDIVENADGSATITFDIPDEVKNNLKKTFKWKRWSQKRFETLVIKALTDAARKGEEENGIRQS
jgi:hypothetical protein